jgi:dienelactone hydrolase
MNYLNPHTHDLDRSTPTVTTICGSTRFRQEMADANRDLTLAGHIVLAPGVFAHDGGEITEAQKVALDRLHFQKIDMADEILVVSDATGYYGDSTRREIEYAHRTGKPVRYLEPVAATPNGADRG